MNNIAFNMDCMEGMKQYPDKYFELAIIDPPYGLERHQRGSLRIDKSGKSENGLLWDIAPTQDYFDELFRVSKNQIIWGANNFTLPKTEYFIIWDKQQTVDNFASAEYAWTNCKIPAKVFRYSIHKTMSDRKKDGGKIHPTQKPVALYKWILNNYAKERDKILDTHLGSGSSRIACYDYQFDFTGYELDKDYFDLQEERFKQYTAQIQLFDLEV